MPEKHEIEKNCVALVLLCTSGTLLRNVQKTKRQALRTTNNILKFKYGVRKRWKI